MLSKITVPFKQVDVFTSSLYKGNPVAVINLWDIGDGEISDKQLQALANWTNLSETTFLLRPTDPKIADYRLRIFTPHSELPFAGHPTLGSCRAFIEFTGSTKTLIKQECKVGVVSLTVRGKELSFEAIRTEISPISKEEIDGFREAVGVEPISEPKLLDVGPHWIVFLAQDSNICYNANPDFTLISALTVKYKRDGVILAGKFPDSENRFEMRAFAPADGVPEDPVCGSGSVALARYLQDYNKYDDSYSFTISQGGRLGRDGKISVLIDRTDKEKVGYNVGGQAHTIINGKISV